MFCSAMGFVFVYSGYIDIPPFKVANVFLFQCALLRFLFFLASRRAFEV